MARFSGGDCEMRDPKRIKRICKKLEKIWNTVPDQRLGQLLSNYIFGYKTDIFFQEDNISEQILDEIVEEIKE